MCSGVLSGSAGTKLSFSRKNPPNSGRKNTTNINIVRNTARPKYL